MVFSTDYPVILINIPSGKQWNSSWISHCKTDSISNTVTHPSIDQVFRVLYPFDVTYEGDCQLTIIWFPYSFHSSFHTDTSPSIHYRKAALFGSLAQLSKISMLDKNLDASSSLCIQISAPHEQFSTFNGSWETHLLLSEVSQAHPKMCNMLHLHVMTVHIHHAIEILSLWAKIQRN